MNYKIEVKNKDESKEAQELFFELGCEWPVIPSRQIIDKVLPWIICRDGKLSHCSNSYQLEHLPNLKEITLGELRALVSLHKNPINMDKVLSEVRSDALGLLDGAKEYLVKTNNGYSYTMASKCWNDNWIEIPEGTIKARFYPLDPYGLEFENDKQQWWDDEEQSWVGYGLKEYAGAEKHSRIVWQRHTQPEELPFVDDEPSLNDQYAEIEQVRQASITDTLNERQSTYGDFSMVAEMTQGLLFVMSQYGYDDMPNTHKESIHMIASKLARIINGNHDHKDSWHDIAGYATLIENL